MIMSNPIVEHPFSKELLRARQLSAAHDEMKWIINHVIIPEFKELIQVFIKKSYPWDINVHGHGVIFNFGKPNKPFTIAYCGYPEDLEFELAITADIVDEKEAAADSGDVESEVSEEIEAELADLDDHFLSKSEPDEDDLIDFGFDEFVNRYPSEESEEPDEPKLKSTAKEADKLGEPASKRIRFPMVSPTSVRLMFERFLTEHASELDYVAEYQSFELHDINHKGPYQLRIEDEDASSIIATVEEFNGILNMASTLSKSFRGKDLIITSEDGSLVC